MPQSTPLTPASFVEFVRVHKFAIVHFWAIWNGHDVVMKKLIESQIPDCNSTASSVCHALSFIAKVHSFALASVSLPLRSWFSI